MFLLGFTLHNLEEAIWLPEWSKSSGRFHPKVEKNEFHFALIGCTTLGYLLTFLALALGQSNPFIKYLYLGFVMLMSLNSFFPHALATIILRKYAPGTLTGLILNLPIGLYIILCRYGSQIEMGKFIIGTILMIVIMAGSIKPMLKIGKRIIHEY
jgi:hypothetical protein